MTTFNKIIFVCVLLLCNGATSAESYPLVRRSQLTGMVKEASQAIKGIAREAGHSKLSKAPSGKGLSMPGRSHLVNDLGTSSPKSILRPKQVSPQRSKFSNRVSFHERHVVQPSSSSKHTMPPYGGSLRHVQEHQGTSKFNKQESFKNPWGQSSNSATSKAKNNEGSKKNRSQPQGSKFFQSMHSRQQSIRQSYTGGGGGGRAKSSASTAHSPAPSHSPTHPSGGTGEQHAEKPLKGIAKVARDYPGLGFAVTGAAMIVGTTGIVTHNMRAKEEEVMRKKKELGVPPVDLSKERKAAQEKLQKQSQASNPPPPAPPPPAAAKGKN